VVPSLKHDSHWYNTKAILNSWVKLQILQFLWLIQGHLIVPPSHRLRQANHYLDKPILTCFGPVAPPCPDMVTPGSKDTRDNPSKLFLRCEAKLRVGSDWLWAHPNYNLVLNGASLPRRLLWQKLQDGKRIPSQNLWKDPCATVIGMDGVLLEVRNRKWGCCPWSLVATSKILALKLTASLRSMRGSVSSLFESLLDFPK
jgi:hypothetical protein